MKWIAGFQSLMISLLLAVVAFFYYPPEAAQHDLERAVAQQTAWHLSAQGKLAQEPLQLDLVKHQGELFFRISYLPIKLLNNQWIALGASNHLFSHLELTRRLTTLHDLMDRQERYAFQWDAEALKLFPGLPPQAGVLALKARSALPLQFNEGVFVGAVEYQDPFVHEAPVPPRSLAEVVAQLQEIARMRNGRPKPLPYLMPGSVDTTAFSSDFDHDGLSDALEIFWGTDPANPDSDNDTYLDGDEVNRGYNPTGEGRLTSRR